LFFLLWFCSLRFLLIFCCSGPAGVAFDQASLGPVGVGGGGGGGGPGFEPPFDNAAAVGGAVGGFDPQAMGAVGYEPPANRNLGRTEFRKMKKMIFFL
jgi:hypothetical protein